MTVIREGSSTWGDVIARLDGDQVLEGDSMFGDVVVHIDGDLIRKGTGWTADVIANLDDTEIRKGRSSWGDVLCKIEGDEIVKDWTSSAMFNIDGEANDIEKAALAVAALILTGELDEADSDADTSEVEDSDSIPSDLDESDSSDDSDLESYTTASQIEPPAHTTVTARKPAALSEPTRKDHTGDGCLVFFVLAALVGGLIYFRPHIVNDAIYTISSALQKKSELPEQRLEQLIVGSWNHHVLFSEYFADGTYVKHPRRGDDETGKWQILNSTLFHTPDQGLTSSNKIIQLNNDEMALSFGDDSQPLVFTRSN